MYMADKLKAGVVHAQVANVINALIDEIAELREIIVGKDAPVGPAPKKAPAKAAAKKSTAEELVEAAAGK
jgi:hypothetical protein